MTVVVALCASGVDDTKATTADCSDTPPTVNPVYVAPPPVGNDSNTGSSNSVTSPLATLGAAISMASGEIQQGATSVTIYLEGGEYILMPPATTPLAPAVAILPSNTSENATITITNYPGESVTLSGAYEFSGGDSSVGSWATTNLTVYDGDNTNGLTKSVTVQKFSFNQSPPPGTVGATLVPDLAARLSALQAASVNGGHGSITQLFVEQSGASQYTAMTRARQPNKAMNIDTRDFTIKEDSNHLLYTGQTRLLGAPYFNSTNNPQVPFVGFNAAWVDTAGSGNSGVFTPILDGNTQIVFSRCDVQVRATIDGSLYFNQPIGGSPRFQAVLADLENNTTSPGSPPVLPSYYPPYITVGSPPGTPPVLPAYDPPYGSDSTYNLAFNEEYGSALAGIPATSSITEPPAGQEETWNRGWLENNKLFVDTPGEWYFDEHDPNGLALYYYPASGENVATDTFHIPVTYTFIGLEGVEGQPVVNVRIIGENDNPGTKLGHAGPYYITFEHSAWKLESGRGNSLYYAGVNLSAGLSGIIDGQWIGGSNPPVGTQLGDGLVVECCQFLQFGANAITLGGNRVFSCGQQDRAFYDHQVRSRIVNSLICNNSFTSGGGTGVRIDDYPRLDPSRSFIMLQSGVSTGANVPPDNNSIDSNSVVSTGQIFYDAPSIAVIHFFNTKIKDNSITSVPYIGIFAGSGAQRVRNITGQKLTVSGNSINEAMCELYDGGGIYSGGGDLVTVTTNAITNTGTSRAADAVLLPSSGIPLPHFPDIYFDAETFDPVASGNTITALYYTVSGGNYSGQTTGTLYADPNGLGSPQVPLQGEDLGPYNGVLTPGGFIINGVFVPYTDPGATVIINGVTLNGTQPLNPNPSERLLNCCGNN